MDHSRSFMKAIIISHRFNPGHLSHMIASFKLLLEAGANVRFFWNPEFSIFSVGQYNQSLATRSDLLSLTKGDLVLIWFPSLSALLDMLLLRVFTQAKVVYVLHEPFSSIQSYKQSGFSWFKTLKIVLISIVNYGLVACAHKVILPSNAAFKTFKTNYRQSKPAALFPLMYDDQAATILPLERRKFISYIGTVAEDHAFDEFLKYACWAMDELASGKGIQYLIATRSALSPEIYQRLRPYLDRGVLHVQSGRPLTNEEIGDFYARSIVVWNAYRRSMQSGVLPNAYMFGTPVLITSLNRSEYFEDGVTGVEVGHQYDPIQIKSAIDTIVINFSQYSQACRAIFMGKFFYRAYSKPLVQFITAEND